MFRPTPRRSNRLWTYHFLWRVTLVRWCKHHRINSYWYIKSGGTDV